MAKPSRRTLSLSRPLDEYMVYDSAVSRQQGRTTRILKLARVVALTRSTCVTLICPTHSMARAVADKAERLGYAPGDGRLIVTSLAEFAETDPAIHGRVMTDHTVAEQLLRKDWPDVPWLTHAEDFAAFQQLQLDESRIVEPV